MEFLPTKLQETNPTRDAFRIPVPLSHANRHFKVYKKLTSL